MDAGDRQKTVQLIQATREGHPDAKRELFGRLYDELRRIARCKVGWRAYGHTMQATALANEAYIFFEKHFPVPPKDEPENREAFFRMVALAMRAILKDHWRRKRARKRGGGTPPLTLGEHEPIAADAADFERFDFLDLDEALDRLEQRNGRWFSVVMHRYFGGRSIEDTAELMNISPATVKKDWQLAKGWLRRELAGGGENESRT